VSDQARELDGTKGEPFLALGAITGGRAQDVRVHNRHH
jgi:hypothetical protein